MHPSELPSNQLMLVKEMQQVAQQASIAMNEYSENKTRNPNHNSHKLLQTGARLAELEKEVTAQSITSCNSDTNACVLEFGSKFEYQASYPYPNPNRTLASTHPAPTLRWLPV